MIEQFTLRQNIDGFRGIYTELLGERRWLPSTVVAVDQVAEPVPVPVPALAIGPAAEPEVGYGWWERAGASG